MAKVDGGYLVAKMLKEEGVECVFTLTGGHIMPILYACTDLGIDVIDMRHECAAAYAADAYARVKGKPGVVITTAGPGVTDTLTAMAEAADTGIPVIQIGGGGHQRQNDMGAAQNIDTVTAMGAFCKFSRKCIYPERIPEYMAMAFRHAMDDTPGPVYIEFPTNILHEKFGAAFEEEDIYFPTNYRTDFMAFGDPSCIKEAAKLLAEAKKPVIVLGEQSRFTSQYGEYVEKLVNYLKIPVLSTPLAVTRGVFADESKNELFSLGEAAAAQADVILELAVNNLSHISYGRAPFFNANAKIIQAHPDKTKIGFNTRADIGIVAGAGACAMQLFEEVSKLTAPRDDDNWVNEARELTKKARTLFIEGSQSDILPVHPGRLAAEVAKFLEKNGQDWHVICDGGDAAQWILYNAVARYPGQVIKFGNLGTIGAGPGFTVGAWAADKKPVLYYSGDGSFGFYSMEWDTMAKQNIPVVCVISNDSAWGMIKISQELQNPEFIKNRGGHHSANLLHHMREYEKIPTMWGGVGVKVTAIEDIIPAIEKVWKSGKPGIVNVEIDGVKYSPRTRSFAGI